MRWALKNKRTETRAIELGRNEEEPLYLELVSRGKVRKLLDGAYEIFSMEALNGEGQRAEKGDFVKVNPEGEVHPNLRTFFLANHKHIEGNRYEQIPFPVRVWSAEEDMCPEVEFLLKEGRLILDVNSFDKYYNAFLWGTNLSAAKDAYLVMHKVLIDEKGQIDHISFNFVEHQEFQKTYSFIEQ